MVCRQGWTWDMPILYNGAEGYAIDGNDYGQMMAIWKLLAAVKGKNLAEMMAEGELIDRIARAATGDD